MRKYLGLCCLLVGFTVGDYSPTPDEAAESDKPPPAPPAPTQYLELQDWKQDFVLETHQIHIEGYPTAFNPGVVRWRGHYLMSFRIRDPNTGMVNDIGLVWLDDDFKPTGQVHILKIQLDEPSLLPHVQDPRLIAIDNRLYMVYSNMIFKDEFFREIKRMYLGEIAFDGQTFTIEWPECLYQFERSGDRWEKNWTPFEYKEQLLLAYSLTPHRIMWPLRGTRECLDFASTQILTSWQWGDLRGGTPAILDGDHYLGFFHSSTYLKTANSDGKKIQHYFMGAYTFSAHPPFQIEKISRKPIVGDGFYQGPAHKTWKPLRVVFPTGLLVEPGIVWVFYGKQDHEIWVAKIDKKKLMDSLVEVK
jgi:predicted GH43/DUF377 family glycosyl hydrolase